MEGVLEEAEAPNSPADLPLHQDLLRNQQNKDGKSLSSKSMEGVIEEAGAASSSAALCLQFGLSRDQEKISVQGDTDEDTVVRENGKQGVCENGVESIECVGQDVQTKVDKETNGNSVGKLDDSKEKENNPDCEHYPEVENNKNTGDHTPTGDMDDNVAETEDLDGKPNTVHGSEENMDTSSEETGKSSVGGLVDSAITDRVNESKCEVSVDEGAVREREQELNENGCQPEADGHGGSECPSDEKLTEAAEESEAVICNNEVAGKISGTEDSDRILYHEERAMKRSEIRDSEKVHAKSKDAEKLTEDAEENEGATNHDELVVGGSGIGDSEDKTAVDKDTGKSAEDLEESEGENPNPEAMPVEDTSEMEAEVTQEEKEKEENCVEMVEADGDEMNREKAEGKEEINDERRGEEENEIDLETSGRKEMRKEEEESVEMIGEERSVELAEEKEVDTERKEEEKEKVETAEGNEMDIERAEGTKERDAEIQEEEERKVEEKQGVEMDEEEKERDNETAEREEMGIGTSKETEKMGDEKTKERGKESEIEEEEFGGARGEEVEEKIEKSQEYKASLKEGSKDKDKEKDGGKGEEFADELHASMGKEEARKVASENTIALRKGGMEGESPKQDKSEERNVTKEIKHDGAEEHLPHRDEDETCEKQKNGVGQLVQSDPLKESQNRTCEHDLEPHQKETNKDLTALTAAEDLQTITKEQTPEKTVSKLDVVNAAEDSLDCTGKNQPEADEEVSERAGESDVPNLDEPSPKQTEQNEPEIEEREESNSERKTINQQEVEKSKSGQSIAERETLSEQEVENSSTGKSTKERETLSEQEVENSSTGKSTKERETLSEQEVENSSTGKSTEERETLSEQEVENSSTGKSTEERETLSEQEVENSSTGKSTEERETLSEQEGENSSTGKSTEERETLSEQEGEESNSGQSIEERETLNQQVVERGNRGQSTEKRKIFKQQGEVQWDTSSNQVIKESDLLCTDCTLLEVIPKAGKQFHSSGEVTSEAGQCGEKNNPIEMKHKGIGSVTSSDVGEAVCSTSKIMSGKNSIARKSTSKMNCKIPKSSKNQSINTNEEKGRPEQGGERGEASPAGLHKQVSSLLQHPSAKETPSRKVPSKVYVYTRRPEGKITTLPWSTVPSQQWNQSEKMQDSDDSDIEIISENIAAPSNALLPRSVAPIVCEVCYMIWNNNVLEAIFEGNKAVTVNSKITYGAILCLNRYADVHYWENKEQTLRNVLERADLGRNIGNLRMTDVIKWLNHMIRDGSVKCCDVFDAVYDAANASSLLTSLLNPKPNVASESAPRQENKGKPMEETLKRKTGSSNRVNSQGQASSETAKPSTHPDASPKVSRSEDIKKVVKSTHTQAKVKESPSSTGDVLKGKDTLKSNAHTPKTALKNISEVANKTVTHEKVTLKECSVNLGIRVQVPQQRTRSRSVSSSSQAVSKRRQPLKEVDKEVSCEKKGRVSGPPLSDKESADTEGSLHLEDKNPAEKTARKKFRAAVSKQSLEEDKSVRAGEKKEMLESESSEDGENTNDLPIDKDTTNVSDKLGNEKSTGESEQKVDESEENKTGKNSNRAKEKIMSQDDIDCKRPVKRNRKPSNTKEKTDKMDMLQAEHKAKRVKQDVIPDVLVSNKPSSNKEKTDETDILQAENKTKGVQQDVLVSNSLSKQKKRPSGDSEVSLSKQKKRPSVGPAPQSLKKQRVLSEAQRDSPDEDVSNHPSEVNGRLSPTTGRRTRGKTKSFASTDSESLSLSLENTNDNLSDSGGRRTRRKSKSCASTDSRDSEDLSPSLENTTDNLIDTVSRRTRTKSKSCASTDSRDSEDLSPSLENTTDNLIDTVSRRTRRKSKSCASTDSRDSYSLSLSTENTNDSLTDTVDGRTRRKVKSCGSTDSRDSESLSLSLGNTNDSLTDTVDRRSRRKAKSCASTNSRDSENLSPFLENTNDSLTDTVGRRTRRETKRVASADSRNSESLSPSLENTNDSLSDDPPPSCEFSYESDHEVSGKRSVSPVIRTRPEKTLNSSKVLKTKSQRTPAVKGVVPHSESSSDSCGQQITDAVHLTPQLSRSIDGKLGPWSENTEESTNMLVQQLGLNVSGINLYCNVTDTKILTNGDMKNKASDRGKSIPALETMLKERSNLDGVARDAFDLLPFESSNFSISGNSASKERFLTNQELLVLQNICVLNPENPDVDMFYQILIQILLARKRVLLVPNSLTLLLVAEGVRREFNRAKRKGKYVLYLAQDWDADKLYTAEDFWLGNKRPPNVPSVSTVLSMFCLWKNLEKRFPISFPIALEELCRNLALWDVDKIGICVKLYSRYCTFLYEEKNLNLTQFFLNQPFLGSQTELQKKTLLCRMTGNSKQTDEKSSDEKSSIHSFNVSENDVQILMKQCMEAEQAVLQSSSPKDEEVFRKSVQALKYKVDAYKKEINLIQKVIKETEKKKSQLLTKLSNPQIKDCMKELNKTIENLYRTLSRRTAKYEVIREVENMSVKEVSRASRPPAVVLKGADLGEDVSESMKELVYELLMNEVKIEEVRPALCAIVQNLSDKDLSVVPTNTWIRNFARVAGLKVITRSNVLRW
ncbi:uncharacterized protein LOC126980305 isoform X2 [Eriocheir sinensis]|uniref:uncharacterized protein LOC126980305 isoform X2 n=1 Tax=Eriocheir sinensis TaxID=95602 RepID=UPI0021C88DF7|nr:uncharacterized protein LOC126980305 isoform X2 [Eriocheir sinensis]